MNYASGIDSLRSEAVDEARLDGHKYLVGKVFSEHAINAISRSYYRSAPSIETAIALAIDLASDVDWTTTRWYRDEDRDIETGDPSLERAMLELANTGTIRLEDYCLSIEAL